MSPDEEALALAAGARVRVRLVRHPSEMFEVSKLLADVWKVGSDRSPLSPDLLVALAHTGNYVAGAYREDRLVGACVGFFHVPTDQALHSLIAGVQNDLIGTGIGKALKYHQRSWCLARGTRRVTWTYDPLVARNAYLNIHKLGCDVAEYLTDFYGEMDDGLNRGQGSDRALVVWPVDQNRTRPNPAPAPSAAALRSEQGHPRVELDQVAGMSRCRVEIPLEIEALRRADPTLAAAWRWSLREVLTGLLDAGWSVTDFDRRGHYCMESMS